MNPEEVVTVEAQIEREARSLLHRFAMLFVITIGAALVTVGVGVAAGTYYISKNPDLVVHLISERSGYYIQVERIDVSFRLTGPVISVGNVTAEGEFFAGEKKLAIEQAEIVFNLWSLVAENTPLVEDLLLRGVRADITDILKEDETRQSENWNPSELLDLVKAINLDGKLNLFRSIFVEDALLSYAIDSEEIEVLVSKAALAFLDRGVNLSASLISNADDGSINVTSHLAQDEQGVFTANGSIIGNTVWIPLPFLDQSSAQAQLNRHNNLTERHGFNGSVIDSLTIPYKAKFSPNELSIDADNFSLSHSSFNAKGSATFDIVRGMDEPSFKIDINFVDTDASFALAVLPGSLLGAVLTKEIQKIVAETAVSKAHLYISYPEIVADNAPSESLLLSVTAKSRSVPLPKWPEVNNATLDLQLDRNSLSIAVHSAEYVGQPVENAAINIPSFQHAARMNLHIPINAKLEDIKAMLKKTPLALDLAKFDACTATGKAKGMFAGDFDFEADVFKIKSDVAISDATVECNALSEKIAGINAHLQVNNSAVKISDGHGQIGSDPVSFEVAHLVSTRVTTAKVKGVASADLINKLGLKQPEWLAGKTTFEMNGRLAGDAYDLSLSSPTDGLTIKVPGLPNKDSIEARHLSFVANGELNGTHFFKASWGQSIHAGLRYFSKESDSFRRFGGYIVSEPNNDEIQPGFFHFSLPNIKGEAKYLAAEAFWRLDFQDADLSDLIKQTPESHRALTIVSAKTQFENSGVDPSELPSFHFYCKNLRLGQNVGEVEIHAEHLRDGLKISQFDINMGVVSLYNTTGSWRVDGNGKQTSEVAGQIKFRDGGHFLKGLGVGGDVKGIKGDADFAASWPGAPYQVSLASLAAEANLNVRSIVIEKSRGELLRLIDLVTLNAINVVGSDLNINRVDARLNYKDGLVTTEDTVVELPSAHLAVTGKLNPLDQTVDSRVVLTLKVTRIFNAIGLAMANPFLGLSYISYKNTSNGNDSSGYLDRLTRHTYKVIGKWSEPKIAADRFRFLPGI